MHMMLHHLSWGWESTRIVAMPPVYANSFLCHYLMVLPCTISMIYTYGKYRIVNYFCGVPILWLIYKIRNFPPPNFVIGHMHCTMSSRLGAKWTFTLACFGYLHPIASSLSQFWSPLPFCHAELSINEPCALKYVTSLHVCNRITTNFRTTKIIFN